MAYKYKQGKFVPKNPQKYRGNTNNIVYRSGLELRFFNLFDTNPNVIEWASEEIYIPYFDPLTKKTRRYFVDIYIKVKTSDGAEKKFLIEIKPNSQTKPPRKKKNDYQYQMEVFEYTKNKAKWDAATEFCNKRGIEFKILTEKNLKK